MKVSTRFVMELKTSKVPAYQHAQSVGMSPTELSNVIDGALPITERRQRQIDRSPVNCKSRDPLLYFVQDVESPSAYPVVHVRALLELHEHLQDLDRALTLAARDRDLDRQTFSIPLGPETRSELPKTPEEVQHETQTHATM